MGHYQTLTQYQIGDIVYSPKGDTDWRIGVIIVISKGSNWPIGVKWTGDSSYDEFEGFIQYYSSDELDIMARQFKNNLSPISV